MYILGITSFIAQYGYTGMGMAAFLAGSFIPFSSEAILTGLYAGGLELWPLIMAATIGNVLGGVFNYCIGRLCNEGWVYRLFRIKEEKLESTKLKVRKYGAWMGLLAWLPILGTAITIALGVLRVNFGKSLVAFTIGKFLRYLALGYILSLT
ncbi:MAG: DedA family protein [Bacteroidaceae bacterium]|nr:DedA family protein [Bacteroidaceae bacterium]